MKIDTLSLRNALGTFATGVAIVTTVNDDVHVGMTVNSFSSVSLDPPLVLWSLQRSSDCYEIFNQAHHYSVNVLSQSQQDQSTYYAKKNQHILLKDEYRLGRTGSPILKGSMSYFECKTIQRIDAGDHVILLSEVCDFEVNDTQKPLIFHASHYRELK
jgi:flavin reductase (DIM6/NTAB) family NADH-FMN oxidoreductase RutF